MTNFGKKGLLKKQSPLSTHAFSAPLWYSKAEFGVKGENKDERVSSFCLNVSASQMQKSFKIFEEMPNVHEWPISKLIQRELDKHRASMISRDYLLSDGYLKYFPPMTAVFIPTNKNNIPDEAYAESSEEEIAELKKYIFGQFDEEVAKCVGLTSAIAGGIYDVNDGQSDSGYLIWDDHLVNAVIIDGQHRYKALLEAMMNNKEFQGCQLTINVINLVPICKRQGSAPTAVARDLFVSINNTPVEVDEARLILMDDRDGLATFTQVLVDDSDPSFAPAVPPELIDWRCDQGKHDNSLALSGVLTLRGVVGASMFSNRSIASVDDRSNRKNVQKWLDSLSTWISPDDEIQSQLGSSETLQRRFDVACANSESALDDDDSQPFLFSYSAAAAGIIKRRFRDLYLGVFRELYSNLVPFAEILQRAKASGAFDQQNELHRYLRAFSGQRKELERDQEVKGVVNFYRDSLKKYSDNHILLTVMGQKAVSKALFELYLSDSGIVASDLVARTKDFVESFNDKYDKLHVSENFDECFFSTKLILKKGVKVAQAGDLGKIFWRGIILSHNGEIDYGATAVDILKKVLIDVLSFESETFKFSDREKIISRHVSALKRYDSDLDDAKARSLATSVVEGKEKFVTALLT